MPTPDQINASAGEFTLRCTTDTGDEVTINVKYPEGKGLLAAYALVEVTQDDRLESLLEVLADADMGVKEWFEKYEAGELE